MDTVLAAGRAIASSLAVVAAAVTVALLVVTGISTGWFNDILDQDQYADRIDAVNAVYRQGAKARAEFARTGTTLPTEAECLDAYRITGASEERSSVALDRKRSGTGDEFARVRELSFINGCLGRPNELPPIPLPTSEPRPSSTSS